MEENIKWICIDISSIIYTKLFILRRIFIGGIYMHWDHKTIVDIWKFKYLLSKCAFNWIDIEQFNSNQPLPNFFFEHTYIYDKLYISVWDGFLINNNLIEKYEKFENEYKTLIHNWFTKGIIYSYNNSFFNMQERVFSCSWIITLFLLKYHLIKDFKSYITLLELSENIIQREMTSEVKTITHRKFIDYKTIHKGCYYVFKKLLMTFVNNEYTTWS